jgi:hypothetical protein
MLVSCVLAVNYYDIDHCGNIEEGSRTEEDSAEGTPYNALMVLFMYIFSLTSVAAEGLLIPVLYLWTIKCKVLNEHDTSIHSEILKLLVRAPPCQGGCCRSEPMFIG